MIYNKIQNVIYSIGKILSRKGYHSLCRFILFFYRPYAKHLKNDVKWAKGYLNVLHADGGSSCITMNEISSTPEYDVLIIVPAYNVQDYIEECIESILRQKTRYSYEIVIVNDGSTDATGEKIKKYEKYPHVRVINQKNKGLSGARNAALKKINSKYILFVDSDDILAPGAIESLVSAIDAHKDFDIVEGRFQRFTDNKFSKPYGGLSNYDIVQTSNINSSVNVCWNKIYRAKVFEKVCFPMNYWFEDSITHLIISRYSRIYFIPDVVYYYRNNPFSITNICSRKNKIIDSCYVTMTVLNDAKQLNLPFTSNNCNRLMIQFAQTATRISTLADIKASYSNFLIIRSLAKDTCGDVVPSSNGGKRLLESIRRNDYRKFMVLCATEKFQ